MEEKYYLLDGKELCKRNADGDFFFDAILKSWIQDDKHIIFNCLIGFDSSEDSDSPYAIGNTDKMDRIVSISKTEAEILMEK